jgi:hypothetical protein
MHELKLQCRSFHALHDFTRRPPDLRPSASCTVCDRVGILFVLVRKLLVVWQSKVCSSFDSCHSFNQCSLVVVTKMKIVITYSLHPKKNYKSCLL